MRYGLAFLLMLAAGGACLNAADLEPQIAAILQVDHEAKNYAAAQSALTELQTQGDSALIPILDAMKDANPLASNYLRNAFEVIANRAEANKTLPLADLLTFVKDRSKRDIARRLAFEWIRKLDDTQAQKLVPGFLDDPSDELRREAVAKLLDEALPLADEGDQAANKRELLEQAMRGATDDDQVKKIVKGLEAFDVKVDLQHHYGFLNTWHMIGPFDNKEELGFNVVYPPELGIHLDMTYTGQLGTVGWQEYQTDDQYGVLDIAKQLAPHKGAVVYAYTEFNAGADQGIEFRLATPNAWKLWVNDKLVFEREEYHRGTFFDQYRIPTELKAGKNTILLKILQNEQDQSWAQDWKFQFRVCQPTGMALHPAK